MPRKPHTEMEGVSRDLIDEVEAATGPPDYFVESSEGVLGLLDSGRDQELRGIVDSIEAELHRDSS